MINISKTFMVVTFIAVAFLSACNEPEDPSMNVMATGSWTLSDLFMDNQVVANYSQEFTLNLEFDESAVFINHDGVGFVGTWSIDDAGTTLTLTPNSAEDEAVVFDVEYLLKDKMALEQTVSSALIGETVFTYILVK